jgi:predicted dehydrogenase
VHVRASFAQQDSTGPPPDPTPAGVRPIRLAFLGCGFITSVHSRHLARLGRQFECSYASRELPRAEDYRRRFGGSRAYGSYVAALADPDVDAVVVAVPPRFHAELTLAALRAGKHVLVEKPAFPSRTDYELVRAARDEADRVICVGENDHYKPLAVTLRRLLADGVIGDLVMTSIVTVADRPKGGDDWRNDEEMAGGDAFFEEGIHWLHLAGSLGPRIVRVSGHRPSAATGSSSPDRRRRSMVVGFDYDSGAVGAILYSREIPSLLRGLRTSKLYGREGVISFESNGGAVLVRGRGLPRVVLPGYRDIRGYQAMYRDLVASLRTGRQPEMSLERALEDHLLMEEVRRAG